MNDIQLVREAGIRRAIIVDDGYDESPQVADLRDEDAWESLFDDAQGIEAERITALFPDYDPDDREGLKQNQEFIDALWLHRSRNDIRDLLGGLFDDYEQKISDNRRSLQAAEEALSSLDIPFETCGRDFVASAANADLIVIDLYLGIQQGQQDRDFTVERLKEVIGRRDARSLPSIVLMSQVRRINELAKDFRKDVKLHASAFRHIEKNDLRKPGRMKGLILTLALHRSDSQSLATFIETWEEKATESVRTAAATLRKIDIDDLQHIRNMLLRYEGLNTSSYMLDVFDRVLQYEIESHSAVLDAARLLDKLADDPAPLMISNDRDTYSVLDQMLFVNPNRRDHATGAEWPIAFGDILGPKPGTPVTVRGFFSGREDLVFFVASPECDLIRKGGLATALLMAGSLQEIDISKLSLDVTAKTTPVIVLDEDRRFQVDWDFGDLRTINLNRAKGLLRRQMSIVARLRQGTALSLRQQLLSNLGRVGDLAPLPRSARFQANLHLPLHQEDETREITMPEGVTITGNVIIPRRGKFATAIIDSSCEDDLTEALLGLNLDSVGVARHSYSMLERLQKQTRIRQIFRSGFQGIVLPLDEPKTAGLLKLGEKQPDSDDKRPKIDIVATIVKGENFKDKLKLGNKLKGAGLIVQISLEGGV